MIAGLIIGAVAGAAGWALLGGWVLDSVARRRGGVWRHGGTFTCPRCEKRRRIAKSGDVRRAVCIHCTAPQPGGAR